MANTSAQNVAVGLGILAHARRLRTLEQTARETAGEVLASCALLDGGPCEACDEDATKCYALADALNSEILVTLRPQWDAWQHAATDEELETVARTLRFVITGRLPGM